MRRQPFCPLLSAVLAVALVAAAGIRPAFAARTAVSAACACLNVTQPGPANVAVPSGRHPPEIFAYDRSVRGVPLEQLGASLVVRSTPSDRSPNAAATRSEYVEWGNLALACAGIATRGAGTALQKLYPEANGFLGATRSEFLYAGTRIDRYGGTGASRFFSPAGTPVAARALPPGVTSQALRTFEVVKPFEVQAGTVAPAFNQLGLGTQFRTPVPLETLLQRGILREVTQ
jgi:Tuberculosis necrotizing toxin